MPKKLHANVYVGGVLYGPDGEQPDDAVAEQITNEKAWAAPKDEAAEKPAPSGRKS